jgi:transcriptional regulator with XRE-family HTH domain
MAITGPRVGIRQLREAHGLSVTALTERIAPFLGKQPDGDTIRNVELGHKRASRELLAAWAKALNLTLLDVEQDATSTAGKRAA